MSDKPSALSGDYLPPEYKLNHGQNGVHFIHGLMGTISLSRSLHLDYTMSAPAPQSLINHNSTTFSSLEINKTTHNHESYIMADTTQTTHLLYH